MVLISNKILTNYAMLKRLSLSELICNGSDPVYH
jgi:hypothetical protein